MECRKILLIAVACFLVHVEFSEANRRKKRNIYSAMCKALTTSGCLIKIQNCASGAKTCEVRVNGKMTTDPTTRFIIVNINKTAGKTRKCIEFITASQVKYALKVNTPTNIIFEKQQNGCHKNITDEFILKEARSSGFFIYSHNTSCLGTYLNGTLSLMSMNDVTRCKYFHHVWT